jgi:hypothetical protein
MDKAQELISNISMLTANFGMSVTATRTTGTTQRNVFGTPINGTQQTFTANVIVDSDKMDFTPTLAGGKPKEIVNFITVSGTFQAGDELQYSNHTYKVDGVQPVPFMGMNTADYVKVVREVDG